MRSHSLTGCIWKCLAAALIGVAAAPAAAQGRTCTVLSGRLNEFILPNGSSGDPFGRIWEWFRAISRVR
jgi:hypothetical protein